MTFEEKSEESFTAGKELFETKKYNSCINRIYYGAFQRILHKIDKRGKLTGVSIDAKKSKKGSHNYTIYWYMTNDLDKKVDLATRIAANTHIDSLRDLRHKSDYTEVEITEKVARKAIRHAEEFLKIVKNK